MGKITNMLMVVGVVLVAIFLYELFSHEQAQEQALAEAEVRIEVQQQELEVTEDVEPEQINMADIFQAEPEEVFAILEVPKIDKSLPIIEGVEPEELERGVGHIPETAFPGQGEQIVISGHRDTVFRGFHHLEIGDEFIVTMPYDTYTYEIRETEIVPADDTSVIRSMGEEVLVVTTCYPFFFLGDAPDRYVYYAYPKE